MNVNWLSLRDLEYVVTVAELENFGRAAIQTNVSQPGLSIQIKKIEGYLGFRLFERSKRKVIVTELGKEFVLRAKRVLQEAQALGDLTASNVPFQSPFRLGAIRTSGPYLIPWILPQFYKKYKKGQLLIREGITEELIDLLKKGDLDAVIASPTFDESPFIRENLFFEPFRLMLPKGHKLLSHHHITTRDLDSSQMVLLEDGHCLKDQAVGICSMNKRGSVRNFHATSLETLKHLVATGQGYTFFPELAIGTKDRLDSLVSYKEVEGKNVGRLISLYTRKEFSRQAEADLLADLIRMSIPSEVKPAVTTGRSSARYKEK